MKKILSIMGTRPEVIKMAPVIKAIEQSPGLQSIICVTSQHRQMQDAMLNIFGIKPDFDLNIMKPNQTLAYVTAQVLEKLTPILLEIKPDYVLVQGDTTTSLAVSLAAFYLHIPVGHIEAGLRTYNLQQPFPEEANRQLTSKIARYHFAPTEQAGKNLLEEGVSPNSIFTTGNTVIDALLWMQKNLDTTRINSILPKQVDALILENRPYVLITGHRRENFGKGFLSICQAIQTLSQEKPDWQFIYPVHLNPNVQKPVYELLGNLPNIHLIEPVNYEPFIYLMMHCKIVLTDSGGVQEEAPSLGKPVLVMRETTERPEGIDAGTAKLVGTNPKEIVNSVLRLIDNNAEYAKMANAVNPYGDGQAASRIIKILQNAS